MEKRSQAARCRSDFHNDNNTTTAAAACILISLLTSSFLLRSSWCAYAYIKWLMCHKHGSDLSTTRLAALFCTVLSCAAMRKCMYKALCDVSVSFSRLLPEVAGWGDRLYADCGRSLRDKNVVVDSDCRSATQRSQQYNTLQYIYFRQQGP